MITRDNLIEVIGQTSLDEKKQVLITDKEYIVLKLHICNVFSTTEIIFTDDFKKYSNVSDEGNCILETQEVIQIINENNLILKDLDKLEYINYVHGTTAYYDRKLDKYYNQSGQELRNPKEYDSSQEGYTPFGDE